jgi:hypothetical protein
MSDEKKEKWDLADMIPSIPRERQLSSEYAGIKEEERERFRQCGRQLAYYRSQKVRLENLLKTVTAKKMQEAKNQGIKSQADQKVYAEAHDDRLEIINALADTEMFASMLWSEIDLFKMDIEVWRTKEASNRSERNSYS